MASSRAAAACGRLGRGRGGARGGGAWGRGLVGMDFLALFWRPWQRGRQDLGSWRFHTCVSSTTTPAPQRAPIAIMGLVASTRADELRGARGISVQCWRRESHADFGVLHTRALELKTRQSGTGRKCRVRTHTHTLRVLLYTTNATRARRTRNVTGRCHGGCTDKRHNKCDYRVDTHVGYGVWFILVHRWIFTRVHMCDTSVMSCLMSDVTMCTLLLRYCI